MLLFLIEERRLGMRTLLLIGFGIVLVVIVYALLFAFVSTLQKFTINSWRKRANKLSDKKLLKNRDFYGLQRKRKWMAIFLNGIFYKSYLKQQEELYQIFREEAKKRGL